MNKKNLILAAANPQSSQMVIWIVGFHREGKIGNTEKNHEAKMRPINKPRLRLVSARYMEGDCSHKTEFLLHQNTFTHVPWKNMGPTLFPENHRILLSFAVILEISFVVCSY